MYNYLKTWKEMIEDPSKHQIKRDVPFDFGTFKECTFKFADDGLCIEYERFEELDEN